VAARGILFIDGNNWYHSLVSAGVADLSRLDYRRISEKLLGPRVWTGTRYYIGRVENRGNQRLYADQRRFLAGLGAADPRISIHLGRLETRTVKNETALRLRQYLSNLPVRIPPRVFRELLDLSHQYGSVEVMVEKAVDVMLAVDMVRMSERGGFDVAYLLSADGDFTRAVEAVTETRKKVFVASPAYGAQLAAVADSFIRLDRGWFSDCYR
jgi:hypothetical protein